MSDHFSNENMKKQQQRIVERYDGRFMNTEIARAGNDLLLIIYYLEILGYFTKPSNAFLQALGRKKRALKNRFCVSGKYKHI